MNVWAVVIGSVKPLPDRFPELDQLPLVVQLVAFVELQVSVDRPLDDIEVGLAVMVAVGADAAPTVHA